jgi:hypothetical protein
MSKNTGSKPHFGASGQPSGSRSSFHKPSSGALGQPAGKKNSSHKPALGASGQRLSGGRGKTGSSRTTAFGGGR